MGRKGPSEHAMDITGSYAFDAPTEAVWQLLMDPDAIAACLPGCEKLTPAGDDRYEATITAGVAAITASYAGTVAIVDKQPPASYRMLVEGKGKPGFVNGDVAVTLTSTGTQTTVAIAGTVQVGGAIAGVGQRLLGSASRLMMDRFFSCLRARLTSA